VTTAPADCLTLLGRRRRRVSVENADVATVISGAADQVLHVYDDPPYLLHLDFQAGHDSAVLPPRLKLYNSALDYRHDLPVLSAAVLLRPEADSPQLTGLLTRGFPGEEPLATLRYEIIRVWEVPVERFLSGGLSTLPLAPVSAVSRQALPGIIRRMDERLSQPRARRQAPDLWAATFTLLGLRYDQEFARALFRGVLGMRESTTYQAILAEGRVEEARRILLMLGEERLGAADGPARAVLEGIVEAEPLEELLHHLSEAENWQELLAMTPRPRSTRRRRRSE
jgi:predicted transposase YdaD